MNALDGHCASLLGHLGVAADKSLPVDVQDLFNRFTLDSISDLLFGFPMRALEHHSHVETRYRSFVQAFGKLQDICGRRIRIGSNWRIIEAVRLFGDQTVLPARIVDDFLKPVISEAQKKVEANGRIGDPSNLLEFLVQECDDLKIVRDTLLSFFLAGKDTTASLLTFTLYVLTMYPQVMSKLRAEVDACVGRHGYPTSAKIQSMLYLRAVLNETLRLFPPLPMNIRRAAVSTTLSSPLSKMGDLHVNKGTSVTYSPFLMQRRRDLWGEDAEEFRPERWLAEGSPTSMESSLRSIFVPFNAGQRLCLGKTFAYQECSFVLVRLLQNIECFSFAEDVQPKDSQPPSAWRVRGGRQSFEQCWPTSSITLYAKGGLWVRMKLRE
ncbi:cytochrome P450 [Cantharellus anzutake]|uniref:cytochrome P450 n=1 Tax=Cantharellus anzutake TaxID=1750568 RepID=UPI0019079DAE|nr:cytochrome P450 [Cantharellus anzutake]KAF8338111.1 cytochrome P450 [Cantharellus anzutake]